MQGGLVVLLAVIFFAAQRHPRRTQIGAQHYGLVKVPQPLRLVGLRYAADVLLKRSQVQPFTRRNKSLLGHPDTRDRVAASVSRPASRRRRSCRCISPRAVTGSPMRQVRNVHQPGFGHNAASVGNVAAHHNRIRIQRLRQFQRTGARGLKPLRQAKVVKRIHPIGPIHGIKSD